MKHGSSTRKPNPQPSGTVEVNDIISRNVAAVMVTGTLRADARAGSKIDVTVASTGDATSLRAAPFVYGAHGVRRQRACGRDGSHYLGRL